MAKITPDDWEYGDEIGSGCCVGMTRIHFFLSAILNDEGDLCGYEISGRVNSSSTCEPVPPSHPELDTVECPQCDSVRFTNTSVDYDRCVFYADMHINYCGGYCACPTDNFFGDSRFISYSHTFSPCRKGEILETDKDGNIVYRSADDGTQEVDTTPPDSPYQVNGGCGLLVPLFEDLLRDAELALVLPPACNCTDAIGGGLQGNKRNNRTKNNRHEIPDVYTDEKGFTYTLIKKSKHNGRLVKLKDSLFTMKSDVLIAAFREALNDPNGTSRYRNRLTGKVIPETEEITKATDPDFEEFKNNIVFVDRKGYGIKQKISELTSNTTSTTSNTTSTTSNTTSSTSTPSTPRSTPSTPSTPSSGNTDSGGGY